MWVSADDVRFDVTVQHRKQAEAPQYCLPDNNPPGLPPVVVDETPDKVTCTITGTVALGEPAARRTGSASSWAGSART